MGNFWYRKWQDLSKGRTYLAEYYDDTVTFDLLKINCHNYQPIYPIRHLCKSVLHILHGHSDFDL